MKPTPRDILAARGLPTTWRGWLGGFACLGAVHGSIIASISPLPAARHIAMTVAIISMVYLTWHFIHRSS